MFVRTKAVLPMDIRDIGLLEKVRMDVSKVWVDSKGRNVYQFRLFPIDKHFMVKGINNRHVNAVCFHGYTAFIEAIKKIDETAEIKSAMTNNKWTHEINYAIGYKNVGSIMYPQMYEEKCFCNE